MCSLIKEIDMKKYNQLSISDIAIGDLVRVSDKEGGYMNGRNFKAFIIEMSESELVVEPMRIGPQETFVSVSIDSVKEAKRAA
jgi:hypothetical protein